MYTANVLVRLPFLPEIHVKVIFQFFLAIRIVFGEAVAASPALDHLRREKLIKIRNALLLDDAQYSLLLKESFDSGFGSFATSEAAGGVYAGWGGAEEGPA